MRKLWLLCLLHLIAAGCDSSSKPSENSTETKLLSSQGEKLDDANVKPNQVESMMSTAPAPAVESTDPNAHLLSARLSPEQLEQGWIRLHDGFEMAGWFFIGAANWTYSDGTITVDGGEPSLFCTNFQVSDFELLVDFNCSARTDSGICLRSSADPRDMTRDCYELSIAPPDSDYPTGSLVKRAKVDKDKVGDVAPNQWHTYRVIAQGDQVKVWLDDKAILEYTDDRKLRRGHIGLQHNLGVARFRNILLRPLNGQGLALNEDWQKDWKTLETTSPNFKVEAGDAGLRLQGGPGQLESKEQWDDFILQTTYTVADPNVDSGILFRSLPDRYNEAYECQIYHGVNEVSAEKPSQPAQLQTGALNFAAKGDATNARILASQGTSPTHLTIIADEGQFLTFVNGLLVADVADTREISTNPRSGFRREAGKIALQAHDEKCDITFKHLSVSPIQKR